MDADIVNAYKTYLTDYAAQHSKKSFFQEFRNPTPPAPEYPIDNNVLTAKATSADVAVICIGRNLRVKAGTGKWKMILF